MRLRGVVVTDNGVYHPKALVPRLVLYAIFLAAIAVMALVGQAPWRTAGLYFALLSLPFGWALYNWRKYGSLGRPSLMLQDGVLVIDRPQSTEVRFVVDDLREVKVHGMRGKRSYRFTGKDGAVQEVAPLWARQVEVAVIQFLEHRLTPGVRVTVDEPPNLFELLRGGKS